VAPPTEGFVRRGFEGSRVDATSRSIALRGGGPT
jgi:hypothetical protein